MISIDNPTREEFERIVAEGGFSSGTSYEDYLALCRERRKMREEAKSLNYLDGYEAPPEFEEDDLEVFREAWAECEEKQSVIVEEVA